MPIKKFTLAEARTINVPVVYALLDAKGIFYVGRTRDPANRFSQHERRKKSNIYVAKRLRESGENVRVRILAKNPPDIFAAELDAIRRHCSTLLNFLGNPARLPTCQGIKGCPCPQCGEPIDKTGDKFCSCCTRKLVGRLTR